MLFGFRREGESLRRRILWHDQCLLSYHLMKPLDFPPTQIHSPSKSPPCAGNLGPRRHPTQRVSVPPPRHASSHAAANLVPRNDSSILNLQHSDKGRTHILHGNSGQQTGYHLCLRTVKNIGHHHYLLSRESEKVGVVHWDEGRCIGVEIAEIGTLVVSRSRGSLGGCGDVPS